MSTVDIDTVLTNVRQIVRKCPNIVMRRAYTRAMREWCRQTQWLRITLTGTTIADQKIYTLGSDTNLDVIAIRAMSVSDTGGYAYGIPASDSSQWNPNTQASLPRRYCYLPEGQFALDPTPNTVYGLTVSAVIVPKERADALTVPAEPLGKYSNDIEAGALAYLLALPGEPWTNPQAAEIHARRFQASINNGKAEVQRAYNTGSVRVRPRPFGAGMR